MKSTFEVKSWSDLTVDSAIDLDMRIFRAIKSMSLMSLGAVGVEAVIERLNLEYFMCLFMEMSTSHDLPYHNLYHTRCMILNCYEGAYHENLTIEDTQGLVAAAIYHDYCHSGGTKPDTENVATALQGLEGAQAYAISKGLGLSDRAFCIAKQAIEITTYPYQREPVTLSQCIIRDADLMQPYEETETALVTQYLGLKKEIEVARNTTFTNQEFAEGMKTWQANEVIWHTRWANNKAQKRNWQECLNRLNNLITYSRP